MTDELKCLAHPCDGVMKPNTYDASLTCSACQFQVADESEYAALVAGRQAAIDDETQNPWKAAIIDELIVDNILTEELERDPRKALAAAIDWNCMVALDPSVSKEAQDLQQRAIDAALGVIEGALAIVEEVNKRWPQGKPQPDDTFVGAAPQVPDGMVLVPEVLLRQISKWLAESADPYDKAAYAINGLIATRR